MPWRTRSSKEAFEKFVLDSRWEKAISSILHKCPHKKCAGSRLKPIIQNPPPLPPERMNTSNVFEFISLDGVGPFEILKCGTCHYSNFCEKCDGRKSQEAKAADKEKRKCKTTKSWVTVIVCMITRAVSTELVLDKTCESFLMAFQRHVAENGFPKYILSDNDRSYIKANEEIQKLFRTEAAKRYYAENNIKWNFTPKRTAQANGLTEIMVKLVRDSLRGIFGST